MMKMPLEIGFLEDTRKWGLGIRDEGLGTRDWGREKREWRMENGNT